MEIKPRFEWWSWEIERVTLARRLQPRFSFSFWCTRWNRHDLRPERWRDELWIHRIAWPVRRSVFSNRFSFLCLQKKKYIYIYSHRYPRGNKICNKFTSIIRCRTTLWLRFLRTWWTTNGWKSTRLRFTHGRFRFENNDAFGITARTCCTLFVISEYESCYLLVVNGRTVLQQVG